MIGGDLSISILGVIVGCIELSLNQSEVKCRGALVRT